MGFFPYFWKHPYLRVYLINSLQKTLIFEADWNVFFWGDIEGIDSLEKLIEGEWNPWFLSGMVKAGRSDPARNSK